MTRKLDVFVGGVLTGSLYDTNPLSFSYADDCLNGLVKVPFSGIIPLQQGAISSIEVTAFFENLLPEGDQRSLLESSRHVSTVFGLLSEVGGDTAGSVVILPSGDSPQPDNYARVRWADIGKLIASRGGFAESIDEEVMATVVSHVSISGAQSKLLLSIDGEGNPLIPLGSSVSTYILKPDITRAGLKVWNSAVNETLMMRTAQLCELPVAEVDYVESVHSCLVRRYDRVAEPKTGQILRVFQADLCQMMNKPSTVKYENDGGPSFKDCYDLVKSKSAMPAVDCRNLLRWLFFNLYTGNNDSHAKNLSMISVNGGLRLAPFYDLMCTRVYTGLSTNFAFKIGDNFPAGKISHDDISALAQSINVGKKYMFDIAADMARKIDAAIPMAASQLNEKLDYSERVIVERMMHSISSLTKKASARLLIQSASEVVSEVDQSNEEGEGGSHAPRPKYP